MAPIYKNTIPHFTHPKHPLTLFDSNTKYICGGCKIPGIGKRYRCPECDFDLHEYCGICPTNLSSFLHPYHSLKLVNRTPHDNRLLDRVCNVCCDSVEGLFYRCEICEFDVHPLCTQLPQTVRHVLHKVHPLRLLGSPESGICVICKGARDASSWRYRCALCEFDIHMECVLVQCEKKRTRLGISKYVPPSVFPKTQYFDGHAYDIPYWTPCHNNMPHPHPYGTPYHNNMPHPHPYGTPYHNNMPHPHPYGTPYHNNMPHPYSHPQYQCHCAVQTHHGGRGRQIGKIIFVLVKIVTAGLILGL